ncbi:hypothetical protein TRFO_11184 [Tritrichomonas foetus]|uniref:Uncharacterized protein n=1 Tax=Tritrichomonas foetus TaxID=1144522 RepID=A0A1J4J6Q1_9EUKA|nr:hypothetical protein TRFO_11184 [Tritrichomonas foetus]|eukprot:OHS94329.1 hypothetical protein TRFO_11184 [Tritrichomonas foetus]
MRLSILNGLQMDELDDIIHNIERQIRRNCHSEQAIRDNENFEQQVGEIETQLLNVDDFLNNELRTDHILAVPDLIDLCLLYEDMKNKRPEVVGSSLMTEAIQELEPGVDEYEKFVKFISKSRSRSPGHRCLFTEDGMMEYIKKLGNKVTVISNILHDSFHDLLSQE